jgi:tetratricopeptide (TPR) repeat protein
MGSTGDVQSALPLIDLALEIDPKSAEALFARVSLYQAAKQYDKAVIDLTKLKDLLPKSTDVLFELGKFHELLGNYPAAIAEYEQAIKLNPYQGNGFKAIAHLLATCDDAKIREGKQAVEYAQRALTMQDSVPEGQKRATLAMALAEAGDFTEAIKQAELLLKAAPPQFRNEFAPVLELFRQGKPFHRSSLKKAKE